MSGTPRTDARPQECKEDLSATQPKTPITSASRRKFLGKLGAATVAAGVIGSAPKALAGLNPVNRIGPNLTVQQSNRVQAAFNLRAKQNVADALSPVPPHTTNGDEQTYSDKSASYSKGILQNDICVVNPAAWNTFKQALNNPTAANWNAVQVGSHTLNGPQGAYAFDLEGLDSSQYGNAPSPGDPTGPSIVPPLVMGSSLVTLTPVPPAPPMPPLPATLVSPSPDPPAPALPPFPPAIVPAEISLVPGPNTTPVPPAPPAPPLPPFTLPTGSFVPAVPLPPSVPVKGPDTLPPVNVPPVSPGDPQGNRVNVLC